MDKKIIESPEQADRLIRLHKYLAQSGVASRRKAEELIQNGSIRVNGKIVRELGTQIDPAHDRVTVEGQKVGPKKLKYIVLHKPAGVVCTREDPENRPTVIGIMPDLGVPLYPVGRLDFDATGLVLLTNDGDITMAITHPSNKTPRTYIVKVKGEPDERDIDRLRKGVRLEDGKKTLPAKVELVAIKPKKRAKMINTWLKFTLKEGRNRQIKRMCLVVRHPALKIHRVILGPLKLGSLPVGGWRPCTEDEIKELRAIAEKAQNK